MFDFLSPILSFGSNLIGGIMGQSNAASANQIQQENNRENIAMQKEFAQQGVRWKAEDARQAGLHPLFAMGAQTHSFQPQTINPQVADTSFVGRMGQDLGRAAQAAATHRERGDILLEKTARALQLNRMGLENELLASQIARLRQGQVGPPMPAYGQRSPGGGSTGDVVTNNQGIYEVDPFKATTAQPGSPQTVAGPPGPQNDVRAAGGGQLQNFPGSVIQDQEITNPIMLRWIATQSWRKPPREKWPPGARDMEWTPTGWEPVYSRYKWQGFPGRHQIGPGERASRVTVRMPGH